MIHPYKVIPISGYSMSGIYFQSLLKCQHLSDGIEPFIA
jgi:hypothetical protein